MPDRRRAPLRAASDAIALGSAASAPRPIESRIGEKITVDTTTGCWIFDGRPDEYGRLRFGGPGVTVHRTVYETLVEEIDGATVLHHRWSSVRGAQGCSNPFGGSAVHADLHAKDRAASRGASHHAAP